MTAYYIQVQANWLFLKKRRFVRINSRLTRFFPYNGALRVSRNDYTRSLTGTYDLIEKKKIKNVRVLSNCKKKKKVLWQRRRVWKAYSVTSAIRATIRARRGCKNRPRYKRILRRFSRKRRFFFHFRKFFLLRSLRPSTATDAGFSLLRVSREKRWMRSTDRCPDNAISLKNRSGDKQSARPVVLYRGYTFTCINTTSWLGWGTNVIHARPVVISKLCVWNFRNRVIKIV